MNASMSQLDPHLAALAEALGVQLHWTDHTGQRREADTEALLAVLRALGEPLDDPGQASTNLAALRARRATRLAEPCVVLDHGTGVVQIGAPDGTRIHGQLQLEDGSIGPISSTVANGHIVVPIQPVGVHTLTMTDGVREATTTLLSSPVSFYGSDQLLRSWGVFAPVYALRSVHSARRGGPDLGDLQTLCSWVGSLGGDVVNTLPLLACFLDEPFEPSPYSPVSRCHFNELYLDLDQIPELSTANGRALLRSTRFDRAMRALDSSDLIDYPAWARAKREALTLATRELHVGTPHRKQAFKQFLSEHPHVTEYARFRGATVQFSTSWRNWPDAARQGQLTTADIDEPARRYHEAVQFWLHEQLAALTDRVDADGLGLGLGLDLPLGVHGDGFDAWQHQRSLAHGVSVGAPPDALFTSGQNWGVPALHPQRSRETGHAWIQQSLQAHLKYAGLLRIDHALGLHRRFWIPNGMDASRGVYVRYPADELYALLAIESHRFQTILACEDLGTVPPELPTAMLKHGARGLHVGQYQIGRDGMAVGAPGCVASLNTHDTPTFAGFFQGADLDDNLQLGLHDEEQVQWIKGERRWSLEHLADDQGNATQDGMDACLNQLARGPAGVVVVNLEDLWLEERPHNVPGTWRERPNWRRRMRRWLNEVVTDRGLKERLTRVHRARAETADTPFDNAASERQD